MLGEFGEEVWDGTSGTSKCRGGARDEGLSIKDRGAGKGRSRRDLSSGRGLQCKGAAGVQWRKRPLRGWDQWGRAGPATRGGVVRRGGRARLLQLTSRNPGDARAWRGAV